MLELIVNKKITTMDYTPVTENLLWKQFLTLNSIMIFHYIY